MNTSFINNLNIGTNYQTENLGKPPLRGKITQLELYGIKKQFS